MALSPESGLIPQNVLAKAIKKSIEEEIARSYDEKIKELTSELEERKAKVIAAISIRLFEMVQMKDNGHTLTIEVRTEK